MRPASPNALPPWLRRTVIGSAWSLLLSGGLWLPVHYLWGAGAGALPLPLEMWLMRWHGLSVVVGLFAAGAVAAGHVRSGWQLGRQRASGLVLCTAGAIAVATGYALSYLVAESWRPGVGWVHAACGAAGFGIGVAHSRSRQPNGRAPGEQRRESA
jgi:hypothetical protein